MQYRSEIDGLRAVAVVPVVLFHAGFSMFSGGFVGVDVFFVISGFLITTILKQELADGKFSLPGFYERRARRILPALFFVLGVSLFFAWLWLLPSDMLAFSKALLAVIGFSSNFIFWQSSGYFDTSAEMNPLLHTWSLAVEEQFYVLFPLFIAWMWRFGIRPLSTSLGLIALASLALAEWGSTRYPGAAFYLIPTRAWELIVGALAALHLEKSSGENKADAFSETMAFLGLLLIMFAIFNFDEKVPFPGLQALYPTIGAVLILIYGGRAKILKAILSNKLMVGIGLVSYSAYLWHQPILAYFRHLSIKVPNDSTLLILTVLSFGVAYLSWRFVETPFRNKKQYGRSQIFKGCAAMTSIFLCISIIGITSRGFLYRSFPESILKIEAVKKENGKNIACWNAVEKLGRLADGCDLGVQSAVKDFALIGDSHAGSLANVLDSTAKERGLSGKDYSFKSCPPLMGGGSEVANKDTQTCDIIRNKIFSDIENGIFPHNVIIFARWSIYLEKDRYDNGEGGVESGGRTVWLAPNYDTLGYQEALIKNYEYSVKRLTDLGYKVILIYPLPEMGWDVPTQLKKLYLANGALHINSASVSYKSFLARNRSVNQIFDSLREDEKLIKVKPEKLFCNNIYSGRCAAQQNGNPLYYDNNHLSEFGAKMLIDEFFGEIQSNG